MIAVGLFIAFLIVTIYHVPLFRLHVSKATYRETYHRAQTRPDRAAHAASRHARRDRLHTSEEVTRTVLNTPRNNEHVGACKRPAIHPAQHIKCTSP